MQLLKMVIKGYMFYVGNTSDTQKSRKIKSTHVSNTQIKNLIQFFNNMGLYYNVRWKNTSEYKIRV